MSQVPARELLHAISSSFEEFAPEAAPSDGVEVVNGPLGWAGYDDQLALAESRTGEQEAVVCGRGRIGTTDVVLIAFEFGFLGGSVGEKTGARIATAIQRARHWRLPLVSLVASGGSRVQEGICALRQLHVVAAACAENRRAGIPHITVLRDPVTGGMWAALSASADVVLATPQASVAFGGRRVRAPGEDGPQFTTRGKVDSGQVDQIVAESALFDALAKVVGLLPCGVPGSDAEPADVPVALTRADLPVHGWDAVCRARSSARRRARDYLDMYFTSRFALSGDRAGGADPGMLCGVGERDGRSIVFVAQAGTPNTAAGYRSAARVIELADRFGLPVLTLVDTPGAANDAEAEMTAIGPAIAAVFAAIAAATVPVTTLVIGEGGSGGALALCAPGRTWITPEAYFAVISPEASAAILKRDRQEVIALADTLMLRPQDVLKLGFVQGISRPATTGLTRLDRNT